MRGRPPRHGEHGLTTMQGDVLVIAKAIPPITGGIEAYSAEVANAYTGKGLGVALVTPDQVQQLRQGQLVDRLSGDDRVRAQWRSLFAVLASLWPLIKQRWQFVHATSWRMALPILLLRPSVRLVISVHGREVTEQGRLMRKLAIRVLKRADLIVYVSETTRREVINALPALTGRDSIVAWNGTSTSMVESRRVEPDASHPLRILVVCRLVGRKNLPFAVRSIAELYRRVGSVFTFTIAGTGPELGRIRRAIADAGQDGACIELAGEVSDLQLAQLYREADIFFHPQSSAHDPRDIEGFGISIIDAMSHGIPVVCGRDGGPSEYLTDGQTGFLVSGTDVDEAVDRLRQLVENHSLRLKLGDAGRELVKREMSWDKHVSSILERLG